MIAILFLLVFPMFAALEPAFDGATLKGWVAEGPHPSFEVANQQIVITGRGNQPNWLHTVREYEDFRMHFEYKLAQWAEAAVIVRAPRLGRPAQAGVSLYLSHDYHPGIARWSTGAVPGVREPLRALPASFDVWHVADVSIVNGRFTAVIDGVTVQDVQLASDPELSQRLRRGFIGFPDYGYKYWLRNIRIEDLGTRTRFIDPIQPGLTGWDLRGTGQWHVQDGVLRGWGGDGVLYAPGRYRNFEVTTLVRTHNRVNSGVFLRGSPDLKASRGFEVQIYSPIDSVYPTGSIYNHVRANITAEYEERWFLLQILVTGSRCKVRLDGVTVAETEQLPQQLPEEGRIGLQFHSADGSVEFRDLLVRSLD